MAVCKAYIGSIVVMACEIIIQSAIVSPVGRSGGTAIEWLPAACFHRPRRINGRSIASFKRVTRFGYQDFAGRVMDFCRPKKVNLAC